MNEPEVNWNPIRSRSKDTGFMGWHCEKVSAGCQLCSSEATNRKLGTRIEYKREYRGDVDLFLDERTMLRPLDWKRPRKIFVCSMTDWMADFIPDTWRDQILEVIDHLPEHQFLTLTKRANLQRQYFARADHKRLANVWIGTSVEDRHTLHRLTELRQTPAALRWVSAEPLIGDLGRLHLRGIDWIVTGAESGHGARPCELGWVRNIRNQCIAAGVPLFLKQLATPGGRKISTPEIDGRQWLEFPR